MIIPTLVLVTAMQFGDPQSGAKINDLSHSPWREVATVPVSYTAQSTEQPAPPTGPTMTVPNEPVPLQHPSGPAPVAGTGTFNLGVADPDIAGGAAPGSAIPMPSSVPPASYPTPLGPHATTANGNPVAGYSSQRVDSGPTRIEGNKVYLSRARVEFDKIAKLSASVGGLLLDLKTVKCDIQGNVMKGSNGQPIMIDVQRGVLLFTGQQVAQLDDRYPKAQYEVAVTKLAVAQKEAKQEVGIKYAEASLRTAESDYRRSLDIAERTPKAVTTAELEVKEFKVTESRLQLEKAIIDREIQQESVKVQKQEVEVANTQLDLRRVKTPFNAMVVNVISQVGNYLKEGDPIAEVAQLDKLKVIGNVDGKLVTQEQVDAKRVTIRIKNPGGQVEEFEGFVRYAAPSFRDMQRSFEVEIEVDNRLVNGSWLLKEGDFVDVVIHL